MTRKILPTTLALVLLAGLAAVPVAPAAAAEPPIQANAQGIALSGYDAVAYFASNRPIEGKADFAIQWGGAEWHFASAENRAKFDQDPAKYAPQYGGHCAYGLAQGHLVPADPLAWKVVAGKLYLNYNKDVQGKWLQDIPGNIAKADKNWAAELKK
jgi:YHS domain-containing protein